MPVIVELMSLVGYFGYLFGTSIAGIEFLTLIPLGLIIYLSRDALALNGSNLNNNRSLQE